MKNVLRIMVTLTLSLAGTFPLWATSRSIEIETKKTGEVMHWSVVGSPNPEKIDVDQGEEIQLTAHHRLEGGFEFHGLQIPALHISEQINRNVPKVLKLSIPKDFKAGEYDLSCQFHPKHVGLKLVVHEIKKAKATKKSSVKSSEKKDNP